MTKESRYELQKIDCNCNDCYFLIRDNEKYAASIQKDKEDQLWLFENKKRRAIEKAKELIKRNKEKGETALKTALSLAHTYQGDQLPLLFGLCRKFGKDISFHPNTCQIETQDCFVHRKDII